MVQDSDDFCNSIIMITLHCPNSQDFKLEVICVTGLCISVYIAHLFTMIMKAENIDINSKKRKKRD